MAGKRDRLLEYIDEMEADVFVDELCVKEVQMKLPGIKHKWVGRLMTHKVIIAKLYRKKEDLKKQTAEKMKTTSMYNMSDNGLDKLIEKQDTVVDINNEIASHQLIVEFLDKTEKIFSSLTWDIKNIVELIKLETL
tara:strand:+ start:4738 stop:5145 length:408 start_codon:yes stop_codon:yes gene_type:complete